MEEQIQERDDEPTSTIPQLPLNNSQPEREFEIINDGQEIIEEDILENYEQDFDSISNDSRRKGHADNEIMEDFAEIDEIFEEEPQKASRNGSSAARQRQKINQSEEAQCRNIAAECQQMEAQIAQLQQEILKRQAGDEDKDEEGEQAVAALRQAIEANNETLRSLQAQQLSFFQNKVGKDSFCIHLLRSPEEFEQKLVEEIQKLKAIISMSAGEVARLKRETKKNEEALPLEEENKQQFYLKYKKLKRELEDKKEKYDSQDQEERELAIKLQKIKEKCEQIQASLLPHPELDRKYEEQQRLCSKYQQLAKQKETELKKNTLAQHQAQHSCQIIARNVLELRRQNNELQEKIKLLDEKNALIEEDSAKLMEKFEARRQKQNQKTKETALQSNDSFPVSPAQLKPMPYLASGRRKYYSQTKNSFKASIFEDTAPPEIQVGNSNERYIPKLAKRNDKILEIAKESEEMLKGLGQSSTSNTLKQFKLRLPSHTPQKSSKNLNISLDIAKNTPTKSKSKAEASKLSITQRLERIELLEREDRIYSHKLYEMQRQQQERNSNHSNLSVKIDLNTNQTFKKDLSSNELPNYQKVKDAKQMTPSLLVSRTQATMPSASKLVREPLLLPEPAQGFQTKQVSALTERVSEGQAEQSVSSSRLTDRLGHKFFKKRIVYRQKKISEDYMKILEQRGRKILQLDNESEG